MEPSLFWNIFQRRIPRVVIISKPGRSDYAQTKIFTPISLNFVFSNYDEKAY